MVARLAAVALWILTLVSVAAAARFIQTALATPGAAREDDAYHTDFQRSRIVYYVVTWIGCGAVVFFAASGLLSALPRAAGLAPLPLFDETANLVALALGFLSIFAVDRISVAREALTEANKRRAEAETLRAHLRDFVEGLASDVETKPSDLQARFLRREIDLELAANGLAPGDRDLARAVLNLARRGTLAMDAAAAPPAPLFDRH